MSSTKFMEIEKEQKDYKKNEKLDGPYSLLESINGPNFLTIYPYSLNPQIKKDLIQNISSEEIEELFIQVDRIKQKKVGCFGEVKYYFQNTKEIFVEITNIVTFLQSKDTINSSELIEEISQYEVEYDQNGHVDIKKNIILEQLLHVLDFLFKESRMNTEAVFIEKFKDIIQPNNENSFRSPETQKDFNYICSNLREKGYIAYIENEEFYDFSEKDLYKFAYNEIRSYLIKKNIYVDGKVPWEERRQLIQDLIIKKGELLRPEIVNRLSKINFMEVNPLNYNQTIADIINYIENILVENNKFKKVDETSKYNNYFLIKKFINNDDIKEFRANLQCFRHRSTHAQEEVEKYTDIEKKNLISYGQAICILITEVFE